MMEFFALLMLSYAMTLVSKGTAVSLAVPDGGNASRSLFYMPLPAQDVHVPLTIAQQLLDAAQGRPLPPLEILQPTLDNDLPNYQAKPKESVKGHYKAATADILPGLVKRWISEFKLLYPEVTIELTPPYNGTYGATRLINQTIDVLFSSRELRPVDITNFRAKFGYDPLRVPISGGTYRQFGFLDSIAFVVHGKNPLNRITYKELDSILSTTRWHGGAPIRTWGELGLADEFANKTINVYAVQPWSGFEEFVRQRVLSVSGRRGEWRTDLHWAAGVEVFPIVGSVAADTYGLGYTGMSYLHATVKTLAIATAANGTFYPPSYEAVALADYPLSRLTYFVVNKVPEQPLPAALQKFLKFLLSSKGQRIVRKQGLFLPLRGWQAENSRTLFT